MKKMLFLAIVSLMISSINVMAADKTAPEAKPEVMQQTYVLNGIVSDKNTNETLAGAVVTVNGQKIYTDLDGNFVIPEMKGNKCELKVSLISYEDQIVEIDTRNTKNIEIKLSQR